MEVTNKKIVKDTSYDGSALILAVVLTTLLATVGVLFVLLSRIDKMAASAASENRQLNLAVDTVVAKISQELVLDVPGVVAGKEYYDYPGPEDRWLANLEPNVDTKGTPTTTDDVYYWPQISDVYNKLVSNLQLQAGIISDYQNPGEVGNGLPADADGDGVADSLWVVIPDVNSSKGRPIYAAVRIIDNGGMLNANTAYKFNPNETNPNLINGSSQMQINLMALAGRPPLPSWPVGTPYTSQDEKLLLYERDRCGIGAGLSDYEKFVIWSYGELAKPYTPFDISDELEIRYRFLLNQEDIDTRLEGWGGEFRDTILSTPVTLGGQELTRWFKRAHFDPSILDMVDANDPNYYAYRHIATTCNMDRIIRPDGIKMADINTADVDSMYNAIRKVLTDALAAQIAVNIKDYRDADSDVTTYGGYYGFETPCIYISELVHNFTVRGAPPPPTVYRSYAVELYKPYSEDISPVGWRLVVGGTSINIDNWSNSRQFYIIRNQNSNAPLDYTPNADIKDSNALIFGGMTNIELQRPISGGGYITVDSKPVPAASANWLVTDNRPHSIERDIYSKQYLSHKCIRRLWNPAATTDATLGRENTYNDSSTDLIQAHPANKPFTNIGEIGMIFRMSAYSQGPNPIGPTDNEFTARLNLINPAFQQIFNYLTVIDPAAHGQPSSETRIKGRININTAPWYVIAQLPWMQSSIAQAIVAYRAGAKGFKSIGELMNVAGMDYYSNPKSQPDDLLGFPDLTPGGSTGDGAADDFEERDVIFARISNLVTVRSDVFTAYILVRLGPTGPQRRVVAILDRSQVPTGKVKIIAIQPVPDPR